MRGSSSDTETKCTESLSVQQSYTGTFPPPVGIMTNKDDLSDVLLLCNRALIMVHVCEGIQTHQCNP